MLKILSTRKKGRFKWFLTLIFTTYVSLSPPAKQRDSKEIFRNIVKEWGTKKQVKMLRLLCQHPNWSGGKIRPGDKVENMIQPQVLLQMILQTVTAWLRLHNIYTALTISTHALCILRAQGTREEHVEQNERSVPQRAINELSRSFTVRPTVMSFALMSQFLRLLR